MKRSTIQWHLARDNRLSLHKFCEGNRIRQEAQPVYEVDGNKYFAITYHFDNGGYIKAELRAGDTRSYSVADHFQVMDYDLGAALIIAKRTASGWTGRQPNNNIDNCDDCGARLWVAPDGQTIYCNVNSDKHKESK